MTLTELSIKRPTLIVIIFSMLAVVGIFSYRQLKYELIPKISIPWITIVTVYPGASPGEVENGITKPIENALAGIDKVSDVNATSQEGISIVSLGFAMSADANVVMQDVQRKMFEITSQFPEGSRFPLFYKASVNEIPILRIGVTADIPSRDLFDLLDDHIRPRLAKLAGVGQLSLVGGDEREIRVNVDAQKLRSHGLSLLNVDQVVASSNLDMAAGTIKEGDLQFGIRLAGRYNSIDDLRRLVVSQSGHDGEVRLSDIAEVEDGTKEYSTLSRVNGRTSIGILVQRQGDANAVEISGVVRKELISMEKEYAPLRLKFDIAQDASTFTIDAANAVKHDLLLAVLFVSLVMLSFLHSLRNSFIILVSIPASLVSTFIAIALFGFSLNLMTLLGLSLVIGILVDDSIVVLENIYRHLEQGEEPRVAALRGRNEIGLSALSITLVDVVVFLPLALLSGMVGNIMREFAVVVVVATMASLVISFTLTPLLASRFTRLERLTGKSVAGRYALWFEAQFRKLSAQYVRVLTWSLRHRIKASATALLLFIGALMLVPLGFIGTEFMPPLDTGRFTVTLETPTGSTLEHTNFVTAQAERFVAGSPEVEKVFTYVGTNAEGSAGRASGNLSEINITLTPKERRERSTDAVSDEIKKKIQQLPGLKVRTSPIGLFGTSGGSPIALVVSGPEYGDVRGVASTLAEIMRGVPGTRDIHLSSEEARPEMRVRIDRDRMARLGLSFAEVAQGMRLAFNGDDRSKFRDGSREHPLNVVLDKFDRSKTGDVENITFINQAGEPVALGQMAAIEMSMGPTKLERQYRNYAVTVYSEIAGRPAGNIGADIAAILARTPLPNGVSVKWSGAEADRSDSFRDLLIALTAAILFVYVIMVALYDSFVYPFVVLFSIPLAVLGAFLALALTMKALNVFTLLGMIMLVGLVGKNAILLVDRANQMRKDRQLSTFDALIEAGESRLRPILMTTASMIVGMMPIALSKSSGAEWKTGLAIAIIGGLLSSLLLSLVIVPVMYARVDHWRDAAIGLARRLSNFFASKELQNER